MYTIDDLNVRLLSELKEIAEGFGIKTNKLGKQELIYKILDHQAANPPANAPAPAKKPAPAEKREREQDDKKMRPRRRENVAPPADEHKPAKKPAEDSLDLD